MHIKDEVARQIWAGLAGNIIQRVLFVRCYLINQSSFLLGNSFG